MSRSRVEPGWNRRQTALAYEQFCALHDRYRRANRELARHADLAAGQQVLDFMAGTGRTAECLLPSLGDRGRVTCVEPAGAMRDCGAGRVSDARVRWCARMPPRTRFDRIVCGAGIWQLSPLTTALARLAARLKPGGALAFNIPRAYLGQPDPAGGGADPHLITLSARIAQGCPPAARPTQPLPGPDEIDAALRGFGMRPRRWTFRRRFSQRELRDWMKIPVLTDALWPGVPCDERARRIDQAFADVDADSWRWECWLGWTAWL